MSTVMLGITVSLDGFVAGPEQTLEQPLGVGGEHLHEWAYNLSSWREQHGQSGGEPSADDDVYRASLAATGAVILGRKMFSGGAGPWQDDPNAAGWWGAASPFGVPAFVLTHHPREPLELEGGTFTFVTAGIDVALAAALEAAGERDVLVAGGADVGQQYLRHGALDVLDLHIAPLLLGRGVRLFDGLGADLPKLELMQVRESSLVTHVRYRVVR